MRISKLNEQLEKVSAAIDMMLDTIDVKATTGHRYSELDNDSSILANLCKAKESLVRTQIMVFVECTESDLDIPVLPLFCEDEGPEEEST